jgi:cellulose synthase/poly-beta-1,6-N-acetylglucosamine synthase-like glycosyltransferase
MRGLPKVSVIVPCLNEERFIRGCLDSIASNDYPEERLEILVVDGMSTDATRSIVKDYAKVCPTVRLFDNSRRITPCALNLGIQNSNGELILWMSAHNRYKKNHISKCVEYLERYNAEAVGGLIKAIPRENSFMGKSICMAISHPFGVGNSAHKTGVKQPQWTDTAFGTCYKRTVFEKVGTFNENLARGQDMEFGLRLKKAGIKTLLVPEIVSYYYARSDIKTFWQQYFKNGVWAILPFQYSKIMPVSWRHLVPLIFVISLAGFTVLGLLVTPLLWILLGIVVVYSIVSLANSYQIARRARDIKYFATMPFVFAVLHFGYGLGSMWGVIRLLVTTQLWKNLFKERKSTRAISKHN